MVVFCSERRDDGDFFGDGMWFFPSAAALRVCLASLKDVLSVSSVDLVGFDL